LVGGVQPHEGGGGGGDGGGVQHDWPKAGTLAPASPAKLAAASMCRHETRIAALLSASPGAWAAPAGFSPL